MSNIQVQTTKLNLFLFLLIYGMALLIGGVVIGQIHGEDQGYKTGVKEGLESTLLIKPDNECEVIHYSRGE